MKSRAAVALLLIAVAALATTQIGATIVPLQQTGFLSKAAARQDGQSVYCKLKFDLAVKADYPTTKIMDLVLDYSGTDDCGALQDSVTLPVDIGTYFEKAGQNGYTVEKFTSDAKVLVDLTFDMKSDRSMALDMLMVGSFKEVSVVKRDGKTCETSIPVEYSLDLKATINSDGSQPDVTGDSDVTNHSVALKCTDDTGDLSDLDATWIDGIMIYSGITASDGFSAPPDALLVSSFLTLVDVGRAAGSNVKTSIKTDLEALAVGSPSPSRVPSPKPTTPGGTVEPTASPSPAAGSQTPIPNPGSESEIPTASVSPVSTTGATSSLVPTATTGATPSPVPTSTTGATPSTVPTSTTGATPSTVPTSTTGATPSLVPTATTGATSSPAPTSTTGATSSPAPTSTTGATPFPVPASTTGATSSPAPTSTTGATPFPVPASTTGATSSPVPTSTTGATSSPVPTATTGATSSPVPTSTTGATSSPVPTSTTGATSSPVPTSTTGATSSPVPTSAPVCVESAYIDMHGLERVHEQDSYSEVFCIAGSALPCGTADHLLDINGVYVSYRTYCQSHTCTQKMAYVNGINHSQASRLVHDGELKLTTMTDRTGMFGLYMTGLLQRNGVLLNVLDRFQRHEYI